MGDWAWLYDQRSTAVCWRHTAVESVERGRLYINYYIVMGVWQFLTHSCHIISYSVISYYYYVDGLEVEVVEAYPGSTFRHSKMDQYTRFGFVMRPWSGIASLWRNSVLFLTNIIGKSHKATVMSNAIFQTVNLIFERGKWGGFTTEHWKDSLLVLLTFFGFSFYSIWRC